MSRAGAFARRPRNGTARQRDRCLADGVYFVIGPDTQLAAYQDYLRAAVGKAATLHRLYPRDFWTPAPL